MFTNIFAACYNRGMKKESTFILIVERFGWFLVGMGTAIALGYWWKVLPVSG